MIFEIVVFPLPVGTSKIKIIFDNKEINIVSAISILYLVHFISFKQFSLLFTKILNRIPLYFDIRNFSFIYFI